MAEEEEEEEDNDDDDDDDDDEEEEEEEDCSVGSEGLTGFVLEVLDVWDVFWGLDVLPFFLAGLGTSWISVKASRSACFSTGTSLYLITPYK